MAEGLAELGWRVHRTAEHFPNDAQDVEDEVMGALRTVPGQPNAGRHHRSRRDSRRF
ncbi:hypothetical protein [Actinophytocola oryzae]|uniref:hypothetical protein n=1 Tax=Actinophytocola oryzae TaxID=502181 RepID=UPI003C7CA4A5